MWPSPELSNSLIESYNSILSTRALIEHLDLAIMIDNQQVYSICEDKLGLCDPRFEDANQVIADHLSAITTSMRFGGSS